MATTTPVVMKSSRMARRRCRASSAVRKTELPSLRYLGPCSATERNSCLERCSQNGHRLVDGRLVGIRLLPVPGEADLDEILLARGTLESPFLRRPEGRIVLLGEHIAGCFGGH